MNYLKLAVLLAAAIACTTTFSGCRKKSTDVTVLPKTSRAQPPAPQEPPPTPPINRGQPVGGDNLPPIRTDDVGIPTGPGHQGWKEDAGMFQSETVFFDFDSAVVKNSERTKIETVAGYLKGNATAAVRVEGHCDERGTEEYNRALGERRALAVRETLVALGVAPDRVDTLSYGEDRPADPGHNEAAWRKNRRGEFILLTPP